MQQKPWSRLVVVVLIVFALVAAACGDDDDDESSADTPTTAEPGGDTGEDNGEAGEREAGIAAGEAAGPPVELPPGKLGLVEIAGVSEPNRRVIAGARSAAEALGWEVVTCDAEGDTTKMVSCYESLMAQNPTAIASVTVDQSIVGAQLAQARSRGIYTFNIGGATCCDQENAPEEFTGAYFPDDRQMSDTLNEWVAENLEEAQVGAITQAPLFALKTREDGFREGIDGTDVEIVDDYEIDNANRIEGTRTAVVDMLTRNPEIDAIWVVNSSVVPPVVQAVDQVRASDPPMVFGYLADITVLELMRAGKVSAAPEAFLQLYGWIMMDQLAQQIARDVEPSRETRPEYPGIDLYEQVMVTSENVPEDVDLIPHPSDYEAYFEGKWSTEFTNFPG